MLKKTLRNLACPQGRGIQFNLLSYNCYDFEATWAKVLQKAIFSMDSIEVKVQLTCTICCKTPFII